MALTVISLAETDNMTCEYGYRVLTDIEFYTSYSNRGLPIRNVAMFSEGKQIQVSDLDNEFEIKPYCYIQISNTKLAEQKGLAHLSQNDRVILGETYGNMGMGEGYVTEITSPFTATIHCRAFDRVKDDEGDYMKERDVTISDIADALDGITWPIEICSKTTAMGPGDGGGNLLSYQAKATVASTDSSFSSVSDFAPGKGGGGEGGAGGSARGGVDDTTLAMGKGQGGGNLSSRQVMATVDRTGGGFSSVSAFTQIRNHADGSKGNKNLMAPGGGGGDVNGLAMSGQGGGGHGGGENSPLMSGPGGGCGVEGDL